MRRVAMALALLAAACKSSAPYTVPAAVVNSAIAVGASAGRRAQGDCFTPCTHGTTCNPNTGYCEPSACGGKCQSWEACVQNEAGVGHCVAARASPGGVGAVGGMVPGAGVSPAT
ncbi:MAG TPA: hypothetical protein VF805_14620, partial [Anaeromyxobacteraceae bacterium]